MYIVTGMGRSGTTFLAGALIGQGVNMGKNMYGDTNENLDFVNINKSIYTELGGGWGIHAKPPKPEDVAKLSGKYQNEFQNAIQNNRSQMWGAKEPRFTSTFPILIPEISRMDDDPFIYIALRKPKYVARSLGRLTGQPYEESIETILSYNENAKELIDYVSKFK